ncbi:GIY-YIG nuclease family protein [Sphingobium abikonense]|uniref:GIY-YIG nuclease family protein n=1 Tax=Sphingobium abikonense TaxID=86193 RepID=UPI003518E90F
MAENRITPLIPVFEGNALTILWTADLKRNLLPFVPESSRLSNEVASLETMVAQLHRLADEDNLRPEMCYFIGGTEGPIKIGKSLNPNERLKQIQMCSPIKLRILAIAPGGGARERAYHCQFGDHWSHGEWYDRHPALLNEIAAINADLASVLKDAEPAMAAEIAALSPLHPKQSEDSHG